MQSGSGQHDMTHMEANIKDFKLVKDEDGQVIAWEFRFGKCEDWNITFGDFKGMIQMQDRSANKEKNWLWQVKAAPHTRRVMEHIFDNFIECLTIAESQLVMFE